MPSTIITLTALSAIFFAAVSATPTAVAPPTAPAAPKYSLVADYSGTNFFNGFTTFTGPDPTHGNVAYVDMQDAAQKGYLGFIHNEVTQSTNAYIGVDYKSVSANRESVRLSSKQTFDTGTIIIMDVVHVPSAFGSWPALWLLGDVPHGTWPGNGGGEIDMFEVVHTTPNNAMTMHTRPGCTVDNSSTLFQGQLQSDNCNAGSPTPGTTGCSVTALNQDHTRGSTLATAGKDFNKQNGGVYVTVWTDSGVSVYLFKRGALPADLAAGNPHPETWKTVPLASFSGTGCDYSKSLSTMRITTDQTFCGDWAGVVWESSGAAAATGTATCAAYVQNNPAAFKDAYFETAGIEVFSSNGKMPAVTASSKRDLATSADVDLADGYDCTNATNATEMTNSTHYGHHSHNHGHGTQTCTASDNGWSDLPYHINVGVPFNGGFGCDDIKNALTASTDSDIYNGNTGVWSWHCKDDGNGNTHLSFETGYDLADQVNAALGEMYAGQVPGFNCPNSKKLKARAVTSGAAASLEDKSAAAWAVAALALFVVAAAL